MKPGDEHIQKDASRIAYLIAGFLRGDLTEPEHDELDKWIEVHPDNMRLFEELTDEETLQAAQAWFQKHGSSSPFKTNRYKQIQKRIGTKAIPIGWYLAAASVIVLLGIG